MVKPWLLVDPNRAGARVGGVNDALREARRRAHPQARDGHVIGTCLVGTPEGPCGGELRAIVDSVSEDGWARCRTCKTSALVDWWRRYEPNARVAAYR